jgi:hypothetical protein
VKLDKNIAGEPMVRMGVTEQELVAVVKLIDGDWDDDDEEFDEFLLGYRRKLIAKLRTLRREVKHANDRASEGT